MSKFVVLIPLLPLIGFLINGLGRNFLSRTAVIMVGCGVLIASFITSLLLFKEVSAPDFTTQVIVYFDFIKMLPVIPTYRYILLNYIYLKKINYIFINYKIIKIKEFI